jgi:D-alanyl-D-alanine carboxypeptidase
MRWPLSLVLLVGLLTYSHCDDGPVIQANSPVFDIDLFEEKIVDALTGETLGFCYVISEDGTLVHSGALGNRIGGLDGNVASSLNEPMYCASISKAFTAVAALQIIEEKGLTINTKIANYLPTVWDPGPNIADLSFKDLLQHRSGFRNFNVDYQGLKDLIEAGINLSDKVYDYENTNFALFRIMIPIMNGDVSKNLTDETELDNQTSEAYFNYLRDNLFTPIGIPAGAVSLKPKATNPTLYYNFPNFANTRGWDIGDRTLISGGGGWYIAPIHVAQFFAFLRFSNDVLSANMRTTMDDNFLGWDQGTSTSSANAYGTYHAKNGALSNNSNNESVQQGVRNTFMNFPNGVQALVMINSRGGDHDSSFGSTNLEALVREAFDDSWVVK